LRYIESDEERYFEGGNDEIRGNYGLLEQENHKIINAILDVIPCGSDEHIDFIPVAKE
jgi:hypothetical protein